MRIIILFFIICSFTVVCTSQISSIIPGSPSIAQTSTADSKNWSGFNNPAMLGYVQNSQIGIQFENRFIIPELSTKSVQLGLPTKLINTGFSFSHFGYSLYHEMMLGIGFGRNFSDKFALGVEFNYFMAYFNASNSYRGALLPQVGLSVRFSPVFSVGFSTFNPFQTGLSSEFVDMRLPSVFSVGTEYFFSPDFVWRTQIDREVSGNYRLATGFEYQMLNKFNVKLGVSHSEYLVSCIGFGIKTGAFVIDFNCDLHPLLGITPLTSVKYRF